MEIHVLFILSFTSVCTAIQTETITSPAGTFIGKTENVQVPSQGGAMETISVSSFLGIPYAEPPLGNLRFSKPVAKAVLNETLDVTKYGAMCIQKKSKLTENAKISEDCLFLNIYTKTNREKNGTAVLVFLHGGLIRKDDNYREGGSNFYPGDVLAAYGSITMVTINYRLWILGFYSRKYQPYNGNNGLWDQHIALQWVHDNIAAFGGDPSRVTLAGQHTGAVCAVYQSMYPGNKGLFQQVIVQSGSPFSVSAPNIGPFYTRPSVSTVYGFGCLMGDTPEEETQCMRNTVDEEAYAPNGTLTYWFEFRAGQSSPVSPIIDSEFIKADPRVMLNKHNKQFKDVQEFFSSLNMLIGYNSMDGLSHLLTLWVNKFHFWDLQMHDTDTETYKISNGMFDYAVNTTLRTDIFEYENYVKESVRDEIFDMYTSRVDNGDQRDLFLQYLTDYIYMTPALNLVKHREDLFDPASAPSEHKDNSEAQTFLYKFTAQPGYRFRPRPTPGWATGANNGDELPFLFGFSKGFIESLKVSDKYVPSTAEYALAKRVMGHWSEFVKTGSPKSTNADEPLSDWRPCIGQNAENTMANLTYIELSLNRNITTAVKNTMSWANYKFWSDLQPYIDGTEPKATENKGWFGLDMQGLEVLVICLIIVLVLISVIFVLFCCCVRNRETSKGFEVIGL